MESLDANAFAERTAPLLGRLLHGARQRLLRETYALPVDLFRVLAGVLLLTYFVSLIVQVPDFSSPDGLIDHALLQSIFWYTRIGLFQNELPLNDAFFYAVYGICCFGCLAIIAGWRVKLWAAILFVLAVSAYRWNFIVMYVDDSIMHLLLFWLLLLPVGRTLVFSELARDGRAAWERWKQVKVAGTTIYCLLGNLTLLYLVAGLWKLESPFWRTGFALYAALRLPIAYFPDYWGPQHLALLSILTRFTFVIETTTPVLLLLRRNHPLKWLGLVLMVGFHLGIVATLKIPFANIACIAAAVLWFRDEIMSWLLKPEPVSFPLTSRSVFDRAGVIALVFLTVMGIGQTRRLTIFGPSYMPAFAALWFVGVAQDYQLFNWIDSKNWRGDQNVWVVDHGPAPVRVAAEDFLPTSLRAVLLQSYLHDVRWIKIPDESVAPLKLSILQRSAQRFCRRAPRHGSISVISIVHQITPDDPMLKLGDSRFLVEFQCRGTDAILCKTMLANDRNPQCAP